MKRILCLTLALMALPALALASQPVSLKPVIAVTGPVTLGDIFDGAGSAGSVPVGASVIPGGSLTLNAGDIHRLAMQNDLVWVNETGIQRIIVRSGGAAIPAAGVGANAPARGVAVLTFARNLDPGEIVQPDDLVWGTVAAAPVGAAQDAQALIGKAANHAIRLGAVATSHDVSAPKVVKRDELITVSFNQDGVRLELQAKAKEDAAVGDTLSVENATSKKVFQAVAAGPGRAVVGPEADRLRTLAVTDPSRLALR